MASIRRFIPSLTVLLLGAIVACTDPNALAPASETNVIDTVTMFSLDGTPISTPSAFSVDRGRPVRTDQFQAFDFAFNIESDGRAVLLPARAAGMPVSSLDPGLLPEGGPAGGTQFDQIDVAPFDGYLTTDTLVAEVGATFVVRSRIICNLGVPRYSKIEVLNIATAPDSLSITLKVLTNQNCGYRGLQPGLPDI